MPSVTLCGRIRLGGIVIHRSGLQTILFYWFASWIFLTGKPVEISELSLFAYSLDLIYDIGPHMCIYYHVYILTK